MALRHNKYNVGDRIQVTGNHPSNSDCEGYKGTVTYKSTSSKYSVQWDNGEYSNIWNDEYDSEKIFDTENSKYSVGDKLLVNGVFDNEILAIRMDGSEYEYQTNWRDRRDGRTGKGWFRLEGGTWICEIIKKAPNSKTKTMNIVQTFKNLFVSEPEKTFRKAQILDDQGDFTSGGREVFLAYLLKKNGDDFKATVVDQIVAAQEEAKK